MLNFKSTPKARSAKTGPNRKYNFKDKLRNGRLNTNRLNKKEFPLCLKIVKNLNLIKKGNYKASKNNLLRKNKDTNFKSGN